MVLDQIYILPISTAKTTRHAKNLLNTTTQEGDEMSKYNWTRVNNDSNGNPRYVVHFLQLLTDQEMTQFHEKHGWDAISQAYIYACQRAKKFGGKRFHNK